MVLLKKMLKMSSSIKKFLDIKMLKQMEVTIITIIAIIASTRCASCHITHYCSTKCQKEGWPTHKFICASLPFPEKDSKSKSVYGILLPENSDQIVLVNVKLELINNNGDVFYNPSVCEFLGNDHLDQRYCGRNAIIGKNLDNYLMYQFRDNFASDGSKTNKAITKLTKNRSSHDWRGPILFTKFEGLDLVPYPNYLDIEESDIRDIIDNFLCY
jgi:hypothetical protein